MACDIEAAIPILLDERHFRGLAQAAKLGKTLAETAKSSKVGASCIALLDAVMGAAADDDETPRPARGKGDSLLGKIGDLKSKLPTRRKDKAAVL